MKKPILLLFIALLASQLLAQYGIPLPKQCFAKRVNQTLKVDGLLDENSWQTATKATSFTQTEPTPGIAASQPTEVFVIYDDKAVYVGAHLYETNPDSILQQLSLRDEIGITDWFAVVIDAYQDGQNGLGFVVTPAGIQLDTKYSAAERRGRGGLVFNGDKNWDAVWESAVKVHDRGWTVEMKIPYSAIRFPNMDEQTWNINFGRMIRRKREQSFWNEVKPEIDGMLIQSGQLTGIQNIKPPLRLSATPYLSGYLTSQYDKTADPSHQLNTAMNGGMDIKYGINDAFTLDMTLIPDFGQVQADDEILNLSPFEVQFDENRPFFTEGIELFNKGGLFYSRRVGGRPINYSEVDDQLGDNEEVIDNPSISSLYNASKISGRTSKGLGVGLFNATSRPTNATIKNTETEETRTFQTSPLTNYNVLVLDQNLPNNSFVTLINTHTWRNGETYDANVTGGLFKLSNKQNSYNISGGVNVSQQYYSDRETASGSDSLGLGYSYNLGLEKSSGQFQYNLRYNLESRNYDINDLGILFRPNERSLSARFSYSIFKPFGPFNRFSTRLFTNYSRLENPNVFANWGTFLNAFFVTRNFIAFGVWSNLEPIKTFDYYEPRTADFSRYYQYPRNYMIGSFISTDFRKRLAFEMEASYRTFDEPGRSVLRLEIEPRFRVNDKLFFKFEVENTQLKNDVGYVSLDEAAMGYEGVPEEDIIFSKRRQTIFENTFEGSYTFSNKMGINLRMRHYWTKLRYNSFHQLTEKGQLVESLYQGVDAAGASLHNTTFNIFNIDLVYRWRFAPGSDLFVVWKNSIRKSDSVINQTYLYNVRKLFDAPQTNSLSFRFIYYLDYLNLKKQNLDS